MKKNVFIALITLFIASCDSSKIIYFDQNNNEISSDEFNALNKNKVRVYTVEKDTAIIKRAYILNKYIGQLDSVQQQQVAVSLSKIIGSKFDKNKNTMIHLYSEDSQKLKQDATYRKYWSWIKENSDDEQSYLIVGKNSGVETNEKRHIYKDKDNVIKKMFFSDSSSKMNHLYLKPSGEFYLYYGGADIIHVLDWSI